MLEKAAAQEIPQLPLDHRPQRPVAPSETLRRDAQQLLEVWPETFIAVVSSTPARISVSALLFDQPRIVPFDRRVDVEQLREAIARGGEDLGLIRRGLSRLMERGAGYRAAGPIATRDSAPER